MTRRLWLLFSSLGLATLTRASLENTSATNAPQCPVCRGRDTNDYGYLVNSARADAFAPLTASQVRVRLCAACGALFGVRDA